MKDLDRYSRQIVFEKIRQDGQEKLSLSTVAIIGIGGLGTSIANHICRTGVDPIKKLHLVAYTILVSFFLY